MTTVIFKYKLAKNKQPQNIVDQKYSKLNYIKIYKFKLKRWVQARQF